MIDIHNSIVVSVVIPCYNQGKYLKQTLNSVVEQTYKQWECLIVNDGSTDDSGIIAKEYCENDVRFKYIEQENQGVSAARNNGIKNACGKYILPLDGDDLISKTYLEKAVLYFENNPNTTLVYCKADRFGKKNRKWILPEYKYDLEIWNNCIFCSAFYKKEDYEKTNGYNVNMRKGYEDWDFWLSLLKPNSQVYRIDEVLFHYRYNSISRDSKARKQRELLYKQICLNHPDIYEQYYYDILYCKFQKDAFEKILHCIPFSILIFLSYPKKLLERLRKRIHSSSVE